MPVHREERRGGSGIGLLKLAFVFFLPLGCRSTICDGNRCSTGSCDDNGACICNLPGPSTILDGDRIFLGGKFCDEEQIMCDGTNSFWCEHGGRCQEIVQGEEYACICGSGFSGAQCENIGAPCGNIFCFHGAECIAAATGDVCGCPPDWKGSIDCSVATSTDRHVNSTEYVMTRMQNGDNKQSVAFFAIACFVGVASVALVVAMKCFKNKKTPNVKFQHLSQMQMHGILDDDDGEDDSLVRDIVRRDGAHL